jgi:hypothetical protein
MSDSFFSRWSRKKSLQRDLDNARENTSNESVTATALQPSLASETGAPLATSTQASDQTSAESAQGETHTEPVPTLEDTESLAVGADVSRFLKKGVSDAVKGAALKKLFADPAYNFISDMDDYVEDYSQMATMTTLEVRNLQQSQDLHLFEDPPWKVEAQAKAKAQAEAEAEADALDRDELHAPTPLPSEQLDGQTDGVSEAVPEQVLTEHNLETTEQAKPQPITGVPPVSSTDTQQFSPQSGHTLNK